MKVFKDNYLNIIYAILSFISIYKYPLLYIKNSNLCYLILLILFLLLLIFYIKLNKNIKLDNKYKIFIILMSFMFVLGYSYEVTRTSSLVFGSLKNILISLLKISGYYFFFQVLIFYFIKFMQKDYNKSNKFLDNFFKHPFLYSFLFLSISYSIFIILYYPGIINYDNANQIKEMMGMHTRYLDAINYIKGSTLTNFNPIVHTFLIGGFFKIGYYFNNVNLGIFLYTLFQVLIVISIYSYTINFCVKRNCNKLIVFIILILLGIIPIFGYYSITLVKDTLYTSFLLLFSLKIYEITNMNKINYFDLILISILVCLFRNNGIFIVIITLVFLIKKYYKVSYVIVFILLFYFSFNNILLPILKVSGTSIREVLSIPFQQTARVVKLKDASISLNDKLIISKILDYDNLAKDYNENLADPVKNKFNKDSTKEELKDYLIVWLKDMFKYPNIYIDAFINNVSGYFYPFLNSWKVYHKLNPKLPEAGFNYHYNKLSFERDLMHNYELIIEVSPVGLILNIAILVWFSILLFIMHLNNKLYLIPNIVSIIFCFLSPANTYYRYIYPTLILVVLLFPLIKKNLEEKTN